MPIKFVLRMGDISAGNWGRCSWQQWCRECIIQTGVYCTRCLKGSSLTLFQLLQVSRPLLERSFHRKIQSRKVFTHRESFDTIIAKTEEKLSKVRVYIVLIEYCVFTHTTSPLIYLDYGCFLCVLVPNRLQTILCRSSTKSHTTFITTIYWRA